MPLNRPPLLLGGSARGAQAARQWVATICHEIGRPELVDCAVLGTSELVTNALLHGDPPIEVRVRGTAEHPRIEVHDGSRERPLFSPPSADTDDLLATFGRGLELVSRCAEAWGVDIESGGKTVWLTPADDISEDEGPVFLITGDQPEPAPVIEDPVRVQILKSPVRLHLGFRRHFRDLHREVRLLALAHESDYPLAKTLADLFATLERQSEDSGTHSALDQAQAAGADDLDLDLGISRSVAAGMHQFLELLDLADEFCRQQRMLSLARTDEQRIFGQWYLGEFVRQSAGSDPLPWSHRLPD